MHKSKFLLSIIIVMSFIAITLSGSALAASTTKSLSTNFTLVNLGDEDALVTVDYYTLEGTSWAASADFTSFTIDADGGQAIMRQYDSASGLLPGKGSVVVSSSSPLGSVVQIQARNQTPTMGAYNGVSAGSNISYLPLLQRMNTTSSGVVNSQIIIQNTDSINLGVTVDLQRNDGTTFTKNFPLLLPGQSVYYDLADEMGLSTGWVGSAVVSASGTGKLAVVSNLFLGKDGLMTYNAFPADVDKASSDWFIPLLTSRLSNGQSASVAVQNVSGSDILAHDLQLTCKNTGSIGAATITVDNASDIPDKGAYYFNPVVDKVNFPTDWVGSCKVASISAKNIVAFAQVRYTNGVGDAAAYEGIPGNSTGTTLYVPLVIKRLSNGAATTATIQNLSKTTLATVDLVYTPSTEYVAGGGSVSVITIPDLTIEPESSLLRNYRLTTGEISEPLLPIGWYGTLKVISDQPVQAYIAITNLRPTGDSLMAHLGFLK